MADETASLVLRIEAQTRRTEVQLQRLEGQVRNTTQRIERQFTRAFDNINNSVTLGGVTSMLAALGLGVGAREIVQFTDAFTLMQNKLVATGTDIGDVNVKMDELADVAIRSRSAFQSTVALYSKLSLAAKELALSQGEVARITETVQKALQTGGASSSEAASATLQLAQGIASGTLQGDELRAIRENSRVLAQAIADEFGVTVGQLKALGAEGKITSDRVARALLGASDAVDAAFGKTQVTIAQAFENLYTELQRFIGNDATFQNSTRGIAEAITALSENMNKVAPVAAAAAAGLGAFLAAATGIAAVRLGVAPILALVAAFKAYSAGAAQATAASRAFAVASALIRTLPIFALVAATVTVFSALTAEAENTNSALARLANGAKDLDQLKPLIDDLTAAQEAYTDAVTRHGLEQSEVSANVLQQSRERFQLLKDELDLELRRAQALRTVRANELQDAQAQRDELLERLRDTKAGFSDLQDATVFDESLGAFRLDEVAAEARAVTAALQAANLARQLGASDEETALAYAKEKVTFLENAAELVNIANDLTEDERAALVQKNLALKDADVAYRRQAVTVADIADQLDRLSDRDAVNPDTQNQINRVTEASARYAQVLQNLGSKTKKAFDDIDIDLSRPTLTAQQDLEDLVSFAESVGQRAAEALTDRLDFQLRQFDFVGGSQPDAVLDQFRLPPETAAQVSDLISRLRAGTIGGLELRDALTKIGQADPAFAIFAEDLDGFVQAMLDSAAASSLSEDALSRIRDMARFGAEAVAAYNDRLADGAEAYSDVEEAAGRIDRVRLQGLRSELLFAEEQLKRISGSALPQIQSAIETLAASNMITPQQLAEFDLLLAQVASGERGLDDLLIAVNDLNVTSFEGQAIVAGIRNIAAEAFAALGAVLGLKQEVDDAGGADSGDYLAERERQLTLTREQADFEQQVATERARALREGIQLTDDQAAALARQALAQRELGKGGGGADRDPVGDLRAQTRELLAMQAAYADLTPRARDYTEQVRVAKQEQDLLNELQRSGVVITEQVRASVRTVAEEYVRAEIALEEIKSLQEEVRARAEEWRDTLKDATSSFVKDLVAGKSAADALAGSLQKIADKLIDIALDQAFASLFGGGFGVKKGGGLLGSLFGFADGGYTGPGGKYQPAGVVHKGEYVMDAETTRRIGVKNLDAMRAGLRGYSGGGLVGRAPVMPSSISARGISGPGAVVNVNNYSGAAVQQSQRREGNRDIIEIAIGEMQNRMASGKFDRTLNARFGMQPKLIGR